MKALVAMSGGVDSSVSAYLLQQMGYEVAGVSFELWDMRDVANLNACCSLETIRIAKEIAAKLDIEHHTVDVRDAFYRDVIERFCSNYLAGSTPNPCILCNQYIKFEFLIRKADEIGAHLVATGHYARVERSENAAGSQEETGRFFLKKGKDRKKDQSYVLHVMTQPVLSRTILPLGRMQKTDTRRIAKDIGLSNALRSESQEICFVGKGNYTDFIRGFAPDALKPGPIIDARGKVLGMHRGIAFYTVGQRKRLQISSLTPFYVIRIDRSSNTVMAGTRDEALKKRLSVGSLNWISVETLHEPVKARVKIRSTMREEPALISPKGEQVIVEFEQPQWAPAPGQSAVFYDEDKVIGGGVIEKADY